MATSYEKLRMIFKRDRGRCHICKNPIKFEHYGERGKTPTGKYRKTAWEIDHSRAKVRGGTDSLANLHAAHPRCNRTKNDAGKTVAKKRLIKKGIKVYKRGFGEGTTWKHCRKCGHDKRVHGNTKRCPHCRSRLLKRPKFHTNRKKRC